MTPERHTNRVGDATRHSFLHFSKLGLPEYLLCVTGPILFVTLFFAPWFATTGNGAIHGHHGQITGWETYPLLRYFLLWCSVGAFILPWIVARGHELSWPPGQLTMIHGVFGLGLLLIDGLGYRPGAPSGLIHIEYGYGVGLAAMVAVIGSGALRAHLSAPAARKPRGSF